jgi:hypothetical protein
MKQIGMVGVFLFLWGFAVSAQESCEVLKPEISLHYKGDCKNGLAHGEGEATGIDFYRGMFRKGFPHGEGIYEWSTGEKYDGLWKKGQRHGQGTFYFYTLTGQDTLISGKWANDEFVEDQQKTADYEVTYKYNVGRINIFRTSEGDQVWIKILRSGGEARVSNLLLVGDSGNTQTDGYFTGFERIAYPFHGKITFQAPNDFNTVMLSCEVHFTIHTPGRYEIHINL